MKRFSLPFGAALLFVINGFSAADTQDYNVLTQHNDIYGVNIFRRNYLTPNQRQCRRQFWQDLRSPGIGPDLGTAIICSGVPVNGQLHNVVYVATSENWVYGFDADDRTPDERTKPLIASVSRSARVDLIGFPDYLAVKRRIPHTGNRPR